MINFSCHVEVATFNAYVERLEMCAEINCMDLMKENVLAVVGKMGGDGQKRKSEVLKKEEAGKGMDSTAERVDKV